MGDLAEYIYQQQKAGYSNEGIRTQLRNYGWSEEAMAEAFNRAEDWYEDRRNAGYSVGSILLIVFSTLAIVGAAQFTGFVTAGEISCLLEDPSAPGYYNFVYSAEDCNKIALSTMCEPVDDRIAVEADGNVLFEGRLMCKGVRANVYLQ